MQEIIKNLKAIFDATLRGVYFFYQAEEMLRKVWKDFKRALKKLIGTAENMFDSFSDFFATLGASFSEVLGHLYNLVFGQSNSNNNENDSLLSYVADGLKSFMHNVFGEEEVENPAQHAADQAEKDYKDVKKMAKEIKRMLNPNAQGVRFDVDSDSDEELAPQARELQEQLDTIVDRARVAAGLAKESAAEADLIKQEMASTRVATTLEELAKDLSVKEDSAEEAAESVANQKSEIKELLTHVREQLGVDNRPEDAQELFTSFANFFGGDEGAQDQSHQTNRPRMLSFLMSKMQQPEPTPTATSSASAGTQNTQRSARRR